MLGLQIFTDADKTGMLADFSGRCHLGEARGFSFSTNEHGFDSLTVPLVPMNILEAFDCYTWPGTPHVVVSDVRVGTVWEGRLEDITIVEGGISLMALGYQRALRDFPFTSFRSKSGTGGWEQVTNSAAADSQSQKWVSDNNNRIYVALRQGEDYANGDEMVWVFAAPDDASSNIRSITMNYDVTLPTNFVARVVMYQTMGGSEVSDAIVTGNNSNQTGTFSYSFAFGWRYFGIRILNFTGSTYTTTASTGEYYARFTNLRLKSVTYGTAVVASDIVKALVANVAGINPDQLSTDTGQIEATTTDLYDEIYEDEYPAEILDRLALLHNYEWGVYEGQRLHFRQRGSGGREWAVDATEIISMQRSLENVRNSAYGLYRDANGETQRTAVANDTVSQARYGIVRRDRVDVRTTSETEAETHRDVFLNDRAMASARAIVRFDRLYDMSGGEYPLYALRSGDTLTIRNLPPNLTNEVDEIRTFIVAETDYNAETDTISATPRAAIPSLDRLVARRDAGINT